MKTATKKITQAMRRYADRIIAPEGWTREVLEDKCRYGAGESPSINPGYLCVTLNGPDVCLIFRLSMQQVFGRRKKPVSRVSFYGSTLFRTERGNWRSFDRLGVCDSFSSPYDAELPEPAAVIDEQIERVAQWRVEDADRVDVPTLGYRISPSTRTAYTLKLKAGMPVTFTPSGFGQGKILSKRRSRYADPAPAELARFFDVPALWIETFDHD